jgi:cation:H+ antiporter
MFLVSAGVILAAAEPFADSLVQGGQALGIDQFLLVQWLAPLASEAPEFIVALLFAWRGKGAAALGLLISAKVNQWTLLIGSLPIAYGIGGGGSALHLDGRQIEEFLLTATQTLLGIAILLNLRFPRWAAWTLLGLFAVQFAVPGQTGRYVISAIYLVLAIAAAIHNRRQVLATLTAPFRRTEKPADRADELLNV